jgi:ankyrin repeat protein
LTPLLLSIQAGTDDVTELLISKGADVKAGTRSGLTPLNLARAKGNQKIMDLLVARGATQ